MDNKKLFKGIFIGLSILVLGVLAFASTSVILNFTSFSRDDSIALIIIGIIGIFMLCIPVVIGIFVYTDAKKLGLNEWLWTLVAIFVPNLLGVIIYLVVRSGEKKKLNCVKCGTIVEKDYSICPACGHPLKEKCNSCGKPIETTWKVCPYCASQLH